MPIVAMAEVGGQSMKTCFCYQELERILEKYHFLIYAYLDTEIRDRIILRLHICNMP